MKRLLIMGLCLLGCAGAPASAQEYPTRNVRIIVPFGAGGPADVFARFIGQQLSESLKQSFVIENRPGAGALIGTDEAARSPADGYTLLMMSNAHTTNETLIAKKNYQLTRDFVAVSPINSSSLVMVINPSLPAKDLKEFIALAKSKPGALNYASSGPGTPYHMAGELFKAMSGTNIVHVPHRGSGEARNAVIAGHVEMMIDAITTMAPNVQAGQVRALGVTGLQRSNVLPDTPTISEAGVPKYEATIWVGLMAPAGTPKPIVDKLNAEIRKILQKPEVQDNWAKQGAEPMIMTAERVRSLHPRGHRQMGGRHQDVWREASIMKQVGILSGGAAQGLVAAMAPTFLALQGLSIGGEYGAVGAMEAKLRAGASADLVILTRRIVEKLAVEGLVDGSTIADLGIVQTGIAVRAGDPSPPIANDAELAASLRSATEIYLPDPVLATAGVHFSGVLDALGVRAEVDPRLCPYPNGASAMRALADSKAAQPVGCTQVTEILATPGVRLVGLLPPGQGLATMYTAAVCAKASLPDAAARLIALLSSPEAAQARRGAGFEERS